MNKLKFDIDDYNFPKFEISDEIQKAFDDVTNELIENGENPFFYNILIEERNGKHFVVAKKKNIIGRFFD